MFYPRYFRIGIHHKTRYRAIGNPATTPAYLLWRCFQAVIVDTNLDHNLESKIYVPNEVAALFVPDISSQ